MRVLTVIALAVDAYVHLHLAPTYDPIRATVSEGQLFRLEAAAAIVAGLLLLVVDNRVSWLLALLVLGAGAAAVLFYQYVNLGAIGPLPDMYDAYWSGLKVASLVAEGVGAVLAAVGLRHSLRAATGDEKWRRSSAVDDGHGRSA